MLLKFAYQEFLEDRKFRNTTEVNIQNYKVLLGGFIDYCHENNVLNVEDVKSIHVKSYLRYCQDKGNSANTINTKLQRIRAFFNYLVEERIVSENVASKIKRQKVDVKINVFSDEQINQMLAYYRGLRRREKSYFAYRGYMLIVTFLGTGVRRTEIINLKWSDVDLENLTISVYGKSRKKEIIFLTEKIAKEISAYYLFCKRYFEKLSEYVFVNRDNTQMTQNSIMLVFQNLQRKMNFSDVRVSPHTFRHTFCHRLAMSGMSAFAIQKMMRHENIAVTMRYVAMWGNELKEQNDRHNPLNNLDV
ncbi:tyrosine-type recombinase/integrase [Bacillus pseudomycoides]|uniref:tyrosine-type recombinase/integrase n=1 Tax=Bacillus pseudomycoides TaxID=64104 RepID=UPI000BF09301|nr:tyrosine-type recombinase/integrase [Bacillus pseudomycoides]PEK60768.1 integrase [Bacillus pseudomycoides]PFY53594.1 integrase [Bacillus pseudomycoides]PGE20461.1 integrase [Bacillus pseudomycoides]